MREIKFRAWFGADKKIYPVLKVCFRNEYYYNVDCLSHNEGIETFFNINLVDLSYLIEYIGIKDKNGKEIYDGNILQDDSNELDKIVIRYSELNAAFMAYSYKDDGSLLSHDFLNEYAIDRDWEIIGNTYENPELLEKNND